MQNLTQHYTEVQKHAHTHTHTHNALSPTVLNQSHSLTVELPMVVVGNSTMLSDKSSTRGHTNVAVAGTTTSDPEDGVKT